MVFEVRSIAALGPVATDERPRHSLVLEWGHAFANPPGGEMSARVLRTISPIGLRSDCAAFCPLRSESAPFEPGTSAPKFGPRSARRTFRFQPIALRFYGFLLPPQRKQPWLMRSCAMAASVGSSMR